MKRENDITDLFRDRLSDVEMNVRDGFWDELEHDLRTAGHRHWLLFGPKRLSWTAVAASVALLLGGALAVCWYLTGREAIDNSFILPMADSWTPDEEGKDEVQETDAPLHHPQPVAPVPVVGRQVAAASSSGTEGGKDQEQVSMHFTITITESRYGETHRRPEEAYKQAGHGDRYTAASGNRENYASCDKQTSPVAVGEQSSLWALKAGIGTSLAGAGFPMPLTAGVSVERRLNRRLSLEAGLQYNRLEADEAFHTVAVPLRLNVLLASVPKVDFYAMAGGAVEKCIAGPDDTSLGAEPVQLSVLAGVGVRYRMNERFALFAEPTVSHHFNTDSPSETLRTERPVNLNLLCGLRMSF